MPAKIKTEMQLAVELLVKHLPPRTDIGVGERYQVDVCEDYRRVRHYFFVSLTNEAAGLERVFAFGSDEKKLAKALKTTFDKFKSEWKRLREPKALTVEAERIESKPSKKRQLKLIEATIVPRLTAPKNS